MNKQVLVLNSGSSSIKFRLYRSVAAKLQLRLKGQIEDLGHNAIFHVSVGNKVIEQNMAEQASHEVALQFLLDWLSAYLDKSLPLIVGHRVVHGGKNFTQPIIIDSDILAQLHLLNPLAPLHQPHNLAAIEVLHRLYPDMQQVACFDTAFHAGHAKEVEQFALPRVLTEQGVRRYGFHGLSYEFIAKDLQRIAPELAKKKVIVAHLGNGASLCALNNACSIDSSMGFSALDGLVMGTRTGSIDAGVLLYLMQEKKYTADQISDLLYKQSGLLGVSGISNDMRELLNSEAPEAAEAITLYVHRIVRELGALTAVLEGFDGLVFTGGIGENAALIREQVCHKLAWLGIELDSELNQQALGCTALISSKQSQVRVYVVPTNEELMIAQHTLEVISNTGK